MYADRQRETSKMHINKLRKSLLSLMVAASATAVSAQTLQEAVDTTIKTNPEALSQSYKRLASGEGVAIARAGYYPTIDLAAGYGWEKTMPDGGDDIELNRRETSIELRQMLFDGYATKSRVDSAEKAEMAAANRVASSSERLALAAVTAFVDVMRQTELVELAKQNLADHQSTYNSIESRYSSGFGNSADLDQASGRLALAESNLASAEVDLSDATSRFVRVIGEAPSDLQLPQGDCCSEMMPATVAEAVDIACSKHPELVAAIADFEQALAQEQGGKALYKPEVYLDLSASFDDNLDGVEGYDDDALAMLRGEYNVYRGGADSARNKELSHRSQMALHRVRDIKRELDAEVRLGWNNMELKQKTLTLLQQRALAAEQTRDSYNQQFNIGQRTLLDLLDSENELFSARSELVEGQYDSVLANYRVLAGLGLLLETLDVEPRAESLIE